MEIKVDDYILKKEFDLAVTLLKTIEDEKVIASYLRAFEDDNHIYSLLKDFKSIDLIYENIDLINRNYYFSLLFLKLTPNMQQQILEKIELEKNYNRIINLFNNIEDIEVCHKCLSHINDSKLKIELIIKNYNKLDLSYLLNSYSEYQKVYILINIENDMEKLKNIKLINNNEDKLLIVKSIQDIDVATECVKNMDDSLKKQYLKLDNNESVFKLKYELLNGSMSDESIFLFLFEALENIKNAKDRNMIVSNLIDYKIKKPSFTFGIGESLFDESSIKFDQFFIDNEDHISLIHEIIHLIYHVMNLDVSLLSFMTTAVFEEISKEEKINKLKDMYIFTNEKLENKTQEEKHKYYESKLKGNSNLNYNDIVSVSGFLNAVCMKQEIKRGLNSFKFKFCHYDEYFSNNIDMSIDESLAIFMPLIIFDRKEALDVIKYFIGDKYYSIFIKLIDEFYMFTEELLIDLNNSGRSY